MTTGLEGALSSMSLQQQGYPPVSNRQSPSKAPNQGQPLTVRVLSPGEQQEVTRRINNLKAANSKVAAAEQKIARAQANQVVAKREIAQGRRLQQEGDRLQQEGDRLQQEGRRLQQEGRAESAQARAGMAAIDAQAVQNLEKIADMLLKMKGAHQKNPSAMQRIDVLRNKILLYKDNLPVDPSTRQQQSDAFKQEAIRLLQSLKPAASK